MKISNKSKWMIASSLFVSVALIVTVSLYAAGVSNKRAMINAEMWFVIGMVALAVVTFGLFTWFRLRKSKYVKKLNPAYFAAYEKIGDALSGSVLSRMERKETKSDVLALLLDAQEKGRDVSDVVGGDALSFVNRIQSSFGYRSTFLFGLCSVVQYGIFFVTFIQVLVYFSELGTVPFFEGRISLSLAFMFLLIIFIIYPVIKRAMRKDKSVLATTLPLISGVGFILLLILLDNLLGHVPWVRYFLDTEIRMIFSLWLLLVLAVAMVLAQLIKWVLRRRSIKEL
jgi:DNA-binding ferritin-like protein (Dps family)